MAVDIYAEEIDFELEHSEDVCAWLLACVQEEGFGLGDVSVVFCSDDYLLEVNRQYLKHDYYTDIITFDYTEDDLISGDLFISVDRVRENALTFNQTFIEEINRIMVHGVLHLCGYEDKEPDHKAEMTAKEDYYLRKLSNS